MPYFSRSLMHYYQILVFFSFKVVRTKIMYVLHATMHIKIVTLEYKILICISYDEYKIFICE